MRPGFFAAAVAVPIAAHAAIIHDIILVEPVADDAAMSALISGFEVGVAEGRWGNNALNGTHELDVGLSTGAPAETRHLIWPKATPVPFTLEWQASTLSLTVGSHTLSYGGGGSVNELFLRTRAVTSGSSIVLDDLVLDGYSLGATSQASADGTGILRVSTPLLGDGFVLSGTSTMDWGAESPSNSRLAFQIKLVQNPAPALAVIPEPQAMGLLSTAAAMIVAARRRVR